MYVFVYIFRISYPLFARDIKSVVSQAAALETREKGVAAEQSPSFEKKLGPELIVKI